MIKMLSGNEAVARGAWEAGVTVASAYPGTPSTEILENFARYPNVYAEWAPNEKVAVDVAIGAAYAGKRALAAMKHVGLNVAADSFMYAAYTGAEAGLVIISADDPAMHSSQNEQDNRTFARFARVPCLEPSDSQQAKDLTIAAFGLSERFDTPVLLRLTTRICHSQSAVELGERVESGDGAPKPFVRNIPKYVMVPGNAIKRHPVIEQRILDIARLAETFPYNVIEPGDRSLGIITAGIAYQYAKEVFPTASILRLGMTWPLPAGLIKQFAASVDRLIVIEELDPFIEEAVRLMGLQVEGKSIFPLLGELDPRVVRESAIAAGLLPADGACAPARGGSRSAAAPPARAVPGLPPPQLLLRAEQAQSAGQRRYWLLYPGPGPPLERHPHHRLHGRQRRRGAWRHEGRQPRAARGGDRRFDLLPLRHPRPGQRGLQQLPGDHHHHGQPRHRHDRSPGQPGQRANPAGGAQPGDRAGAAGACPGHQARPDRRSL